MQDCVRDWFDLLAFAHFSPPLAEISGFPHFVSKDSFPFPSLPCLVHHCPADSWFQDMAFASNWKTNSLPKKTSQWYNTTLKAQPSELEHFTRSSLSPYSALPQPHIPIWSQREKWQKCFLFQSNHKGCKFPCGITTWAYSCHLQLFLGNF